VDCHSLVAVDIDGNCPGLDLAWVKGKKDEGKMTVGVKMQWLAERGTLSVVRPDYPWDRSRLWEVKIEIGAMPDTHYFCKSEDLEFALSDVVASVKEYWKRYKKSCQTYSIGGVVLDDI
jgi:hypothetical protein